MMGKMARCILLLSLLGLASGFAPSSRLIKPSASLEASITSRFPSSSLPPGLVYGSLKSHSSCSAASSRRTSRSSRCRLSTLSAVDGYSGTVVDKVMLPSDPTIPRSLSPSLPRCDRVAPPLHTNPLQRGGEGSSPVHRYTQLTLSSQVESWLRVQTIGGILPKEEIKALLVEVPTLASSSSSHPPRSPSPSPLPPSLSLPFPPIPLSPSLIPLLVSLFCISPSASRHNSSMATTSSGSHRSPSLTTSGLK